MSTKNYYEFRVQLMEGTTYEIFQIVYTLEDWEKKEISARRVFQGTISDCAAWITLNEKGYEIM